MNTRPRDPNDIAVISVGQCTPLGLTARATQAEMAAGTVRFFETDILDRSGAPVRASMLTLLDSGLTRTERMASLAVTALHDVLAGVASLGMGQLPLLLVDCPRSNST